jgi:ankyrin repeat protein
MLLLAASRGGNGLVCELLDNGAPVDTAWSSCRSDKTSLHEAVEGRHLDVVRTLLERGIDVEAQTETGETALSIAIEDHNEAIVEALIEGGAHIESTASNGYTALHLAAVEGNPGLVQILVDAGANVNAKGADDLTAIQLACSVDPTVSIHGNWNEVISILIEAGADLGGQSVESLLSRHISVKTGHLLEI